MLRAFILFAFVTTLMFAEDMAGKWKFVSEYSTGQKDEAVLEVREDWGAWNVVVIHGDTTISAKTVMVDGDKLSFDVEGGGDTYTVKVVVKGKGLAGTFTGTNGAKGTITGMRE